MFRETFRNLREMPFAYFHVFRYSERGHTKSRKLGGKVPQDIIDERSRLLRDLSNRKRRMFFEANIGAAHHVLFEQKKNGMWTGLTDSYIRVKVESELELKNEFLPVVLQAIDGQLMDGKLS